MALRRQPAMVEGPLGLGTAPRMCICRLIRGRKVRRQVRAIGEALQRSPQSLRAV